MNQRLSFSWCVALVITLLAVQSASAQFGFSGRTNSLVSLARYEAVQKDLGVTNEVAGKLGELYDSYRNASEREFKAQGFLGPISVEYEYNWDQNVEDAKACIAFVREYGAKK